MKIKVYHITVEHGDNENLCTCDDDQLDRLLESLPDDELVSEFILAHAFKGCEAPVFTTTE